jgi:hypothetical protein
MSRKIFLCLDLILFLTLLVECGSSGRGGGSDASWLNGSIENIFHRKRRL